ncbi:hypothetical protein QE152_g7245 [Popillia japonica]|uniref:Uncharacterized protein n=1 Tax=Popillia japonica TaxID=7064 RepID=A0AAW1MFY1_POPJA
MPTQTINKPTLRCRSRITALSSCPKWSADATVLSANKWTELPSLFVRPRTKLKIPFDNVKEFNIIANIQIKITLQMDLYDYCIVTARSDLQLQEIMTLVENARDARNVALPTNSSSDSTSTSNEEVYAGVSVVRVVWDIMPRLHKRRLGANRYSDYSAENLEIALAGVIDGHMSFRHQKRNDHPSYMYQKF